ncbi:MAG: undecaprenyldiphospho-muramoylpentapeptide beta-N-acetylglucosaminyltransferase [Spirochaetota bacterium]|nr:MAG: undecaprenyldiphospho-muramoylpentapeptide beta-N-acetylglucosaminyltransferase [Spirochaetota bacterium]
MIAVTGGGTGGHIFPNIAIIEELRRRDVDNIIWIGTRGGTEKEFAGRLGIPFYGVRTGKLRRYFSIKNLVDIFWVFIGVIQALTLLKKLRPEVLFSKGGFVSVPPVIAARILRIPVVTHESDTVPGLSTKIISRFAKVVCVGFEDTLRYFKEGRAVYTGNPIRDVIRNSDPHRGLKHLGFKNSLPVVFVVGGSLGASKINNTVWELCDSSEAGSLKFNIVHQCGKGKRREGLNTSNYRQYEILEDEMGDILKASTIIVSRAGAGALNEIGFFGKPSILIPLPTSQSRGEQINNAHYFVDKNAAILIPDEKLSSQVLMKEVSELLDKPEKLERMGENAGKLLRDSAEREIVDIIQRFYKK